MNKSIVICHFQPLELFPPIMNLLSILSETATNNSITVITTEIDTDLKTYTCPNINIIRLKGINPNVHKINKLYRYFSVYFKTFKVLLNKKPASILYFETLSALSCMLYKSIFRKTQLLAHYHEYVSLNELKSGRFLNKMINRLEAKKYKEFKWISQTNQHRMDLFTEQYNLDKNAHNLHILPNYPSNKWVIKTEIKKQEQTIKLLHIGALSLSGMHLKKALDYFGNKENIELDFYSHTKSEELISLINSYSNCRFLGSINYDDIPALFGKYDAGLVIYNGGSLNVSYCAPNKIFEYLALDLDVLCSNDLVAARELSRTHVYPKIIMVDFENVEQLVLPKLLDRTNFTYVASPYSCENIYKNLIIQLNENSHPES